MTYDFDPVKYGALWQKVEDYEKKFDSMERKIDKLESAIEKLVSLADQSRGGFWAGMAIVSGISGLISFFAGWYHGK
jgi:hypothetical protein